MARAYVLAAVVLHLGCSASSAPVLQSIEPDTASPTMDTPVALRGENLLNGVVVALDDDVPPAIDDGWQVAVRVGGMVTNLSAVDWRDSTAIDVIIPAGLTLGDYDVLVTSPDGDLLGLDAALTVGVRGCNLAGWSHAAVVTVDSEVGGLIDYPVRVELDTAQLIAGGSLRADCGDLRFSGDDGMPLDYYVEGGCDTALTIVWVEVPAIEVGTRDIYLQIGNPGATDGAGGAATFSFFDDFDDGNLDGWTLGVEQYQPALDVGHAEGIDSSVSLSPGFSLRLMGHASCTQFPFDGVLAIAMFGVSLPAGDYCVDVDARTDIDSFQFDTEARARRFAYAGSSQVTARQTMCNGPGCTTSSGWQTDTGRAPASESIDTLELQGFADDCVEAVTWFDNVRVRRCANPEPTASVALPEACP